MTAPATNDLKQALLEAELALAGSRSAIRAGKLQFAASTVKFATEKILEAQQIQQKLKQ